MSAWCFIHYYWRFYGSPFTRHALNSMHQRFRGVLQKVCRSILTISIRWHKFYVEDSKSVLGRNLVGTDRMWLQCQFMCEGILCWLLYINYRYFVLIVYGYRLTVGTMYTLHQLTVPLCSWLWSTSCPPCIVDLWRATLTQQRVQWCSTTVNQVQFQRGG